MRRVQVFVLALMVAVLCTGCCSEGALVEYRNDNGPRGPEDVRVFRWGRSSTAPAAQQQREVRAYSVPAPKAP